MGRLGKTPPRTTRKSLALAAGIGAVGMASFVVVFLQPPPIGIGGGLPITTIALWVGGASVIGAGIGAIVEWDVSSFPPDDEPAKTDIWDQDLS